MFECQGQLIRWVDHVEQSFKRGGEIVDGLFLRRAIADRADARTKLCGAGSGDSANAPSSAVFCLTGKHGTRSNTGRSS
jgi:hypothetical protein